MRTATGIPHSKLCSAGGAVICAAQGGRFDAGSRAHAAHASGMDGSSDGSPAGTVAPSAPLPTAVACSGVCRRGMRAPDPGGGPMSANVEGASGQVLPGTRRDFPGGDCHRRSRSPRAPPRPQYHKRRYTGGPLATVSPPTGQPTQPTCWHPKDRAVSRRAPYRKPQRCRRETNLVAFATPCIIPVERDKGAPSPHIAGAYTLSLPRDPGASHSNNRKARAAVRVLRTPWPSRPWPVSRPARRRGVISFVTLWVWRTTSCARLPPSPRSSLR